MAPLVHWIPSRLLLFYVSLTFVLIHKLASKLKCLFTRIIYTTKLVTMWVEHVFSDVYKDRWTYGVYSHHCPLEITWTSWQILTKLDMDVMSLQITLPSCSFSYFPAIMDTLRTSEEKATLAPLVYGLHMCNIYLWLI